jgi:predicted transcriptional regulator
MVKILHKLGGIIIKQSTIKALDEKDFEFVEALQSLGVQKGVATLITILASVNEATSREIEMGTSLRQPEVSIAMRTLRENNWINEREVKAEGKGRPMKIYSLSMPLDKIIEYYESKKKSESAQAMQAIQKLREMTTA